MVSCKASILGIAVGSPWNSLEAAKLIVAATTPLVVVVLGVWFNRRLKQLEARQWVNQELSFPRLGGHRA